MLSSMITEIEAHPHETRLTRDGTVFQSIQCLAKYSPVLPAELKRLVKKSLKSDAALDQLRKELLAHDPTAASSLGTTQAVDLIQGGVKVNALPENVWAVVNNRIADYRFFCLEYPSRESSKLF